MGNSRTVNEPYDSVREVRRMQRLEGGRCCIGGADVRGPLATFEDHYPPPEVVDKPVNKVLTTEE